jgi:DNA-binding response OmpR family regulator
MGVFSRSPKAQKTILVIDDEPKFCRMIETTLSHYGYRVITARSGYTGIEMADRLQPDIILCDVNMEDGDGYDALAGVRNNAVIADTPFLLMTQAPSSASLLQGLSLSVDDYLPKPFTFEQLLEALKHAFKARPRESE